MGIKLHDLPPKLRKQAEPQLFAKSGDSVPDAEPECAPHDALDKGCQDKKISQRVHLVVHCYRTGGNWDIDNVSVKPFLDGLVERGIIEDDNIKQIEAITKIPYRVKKRDEEKTVIELLG